MGCLWVFVGLVGCWFSVCARPCGGALWCTRHDGSLPRITARFCLTSCERLNSSLLRDRPMSRYQCRPSSPPFVGLGFGGLCSVVVVLWSWVWVCVGLGVSPLPPPLLWPAPNSVLCTLCDHTGCRFGSAGSPRPSLWERGAVAGWPGCVCLCLFWVVVLWVAGCRFCSATLRRLQLFLRSGAGLSLLLAARPSFLPPALGCTRPVVLAANYCTFLL